MANDHADFLRDELRSPYAVFHQFMLQLERCPSDCQFIFFEGSEDPTFFIRFILERLDGREYREFVCNGRQGVIKVNELCSSDGRAFSHTLYFIDKDHCDLMDPDEVLPMRVIQTECYSFENYLVCNEVFRRFWTERLRLRSSDDRFVFYRKLFENLHKSFFERMQFLMAIILIGRGIDGRTIAKLNLNNVDLNKVLSIDFDAGKILWLPRGGTTFLSASNMTTSGITLRGDAIRSVLRKYLRHRNPKSYVRGKYELWFFVQFLQFITRKLSDRKQAKVTGLPRANPGEIITHKNAIDLLCGLAPRPENLWRFLEEHIEPSKCMEESIATTTTQ